MTLRPNIAKIVKTLGLGAVLGLSVLAVAAPASAHDDDYGYGRSYGSRYDRNDGYGDGYGDYAYSRRSHRRSGRYGRSGRYSSSYRYSPEYRRERAYKDDYDNDGISNGNDRFPYDPYRW